MTPFICSIVPIAAGLIAYVAAAGVEGGWFLGSYKEGLIACCIVPLIALVMVPMGTYSVLSGTVAIREPEARGKSLVVVAIVLGILEIVIGTGYISYLFWVLSKICSRMG
ncbi:MAG: hypothetical protein ACYTAO_02960 [Planctomycetota bacterium]|jgi:hypothetical protein